MWRWLGWIALGLALAGAVGLRAVYARQFPLVPDAVGGPPAAPPVLDAFGDDPPVLTVEDWETRRAPRLRAAFAAWEYGPMPPALPARVLARETLDGRFAGEGVRLQQLTIGFGEAGDRGRVNVVLAQPAVRPRALIVMQNFCGNHLALHKRFASVRSLTDPPGMCDGWLKHPAHLILGRWIEGPPLKRVLDRGYAVAMVYAADLVPDDRDEAGPALRRLYGPDYDAASPPGALAAWAWLYGALGEALTGEDGLSGTPTIAWGHSRNGKAALLAGAWYPRIAGVIAHQSGRGGAALNSSGVGESIAQITTAYPHWFTPRFAEVGGGAGAIDLDQHQLIALIAPRPVLIVAGDRDRWSDPAGAFRAARGAAPVWELYGRPGLDQTRLSEPDLTRPLATAMRRGTHGVWTEDWTMFLDFLDAQFPAR